MTEINHEALTVGEIGSKGISQFDEEYQYWRKAGLDHTSSKNKAIDWWRKHGSRELLESTFVTIGDSEEEQDADKLYGPDHRPTQDKTTEISSLVRKFIEGTKSVKDKIYFIVLIRAHGLDEHLDDDTLDLMESVTEIRADSDKRSDIAKAMNFKVKENGSTSSMYLIHNRMKEEFVKLFGGI